MKSESKIQKEIIDILEKHGWFAVKLIQTNKNGIADLIASKGWISFYIEVKKPGNDTSDLQKYRIKEMGMFKIRVFVCDNPKDIIPVVEQLSRKWDGIGW